MASEELTKGIVAGKLGTLKEYSSEQNTINNGAVWFKEDSYKGTAYNWLKDVFAKASKKQTRTERGIPDFIIVKEKSDIIIPNYSRQYKLT